jgi:hypothetical protein
MGPIPTQPAKIQREISRWNRGETISGGCASVLPQFLPMVSPKVLGTSIAAADFTKKPKVYRTYAVEDRCRPI